MNQFGAIWVIARSVLLEAVRRKEIYLLIAICFALIGFVLSMDFFGLGGLIKFYREVSLRLIGTFTAVAVIMLATRQLPREFEQRTIYPLMARPISRWAFIMGKGLGVFLAAVFCFTLFICIYTPGMIFLGGDIAWWLFLQHIYLQLLQMLVLTAAAFLLSLCFSKSGALTMVLLLYFASTLLSSISVSIYELATPMGRSLLTLLNYGLPQVALFDLSGKALHSELWSPLSLPIMAALTLYAAFYALVYGAGAYALFRRRPL